MLLAVLTAERVNPGLARDGLIVHNIIYTALERIGINPHHYYEGDDAGAFFAIASGPEGAINYRVAPDGSLAAIVAYYRAGSPVEALAYMAEQLHLKKQTVQLLQQDNTSGILE